MAKDYLISVIVPIYNVGNYVRKCIESIINQTYKKLQIILVDDKSTDQSGKICDEYASVDDRIQVIHQEYNQGLVCAIKAGLKVAKGDYIGTVDGDDWIEEIMYEELLKNIIATNSDFSVTGFIEDGGNGSSSFGYTKGVYDLTDENRHNVIHEQFFFPLVNGVTDDTLLGITNKLFTRERMTNAYKQVMNNASADEDSICMLISLLEAQRFVMVGETYYHHVYRKCSITSSINVKVISDAYLAHSAMQQVLKNYNCYEEFIGQAKEGFMHFVWSRIEGLILNEFNMVLCQFPNIKELFDKRIVIYGAGNVGKAYYAQICKYARCEIVAWLDSDYTRYEYDYCTVQGREVLSQIDYDVIVIAAYSEVTAKSIMTGLYSAGVDEKKIIWKKPQNVRLFEKLAKM